MTRRRVILAVVLLILGLGGGVALLWGGEGAGQAPLGEAIRRFRDSPTRSPGGHEGPAPGVYTYTGRGREQLSVLGAEQSWGRTIPGTVTTTSPECWRLHVAYNTNHWQDSDFCRRAGRLLVTGGRVARRFEFAGFTVSDTTSFTCDPPAVMVDPGAVPGDVSRHRCRGTSTGRGGFVLRERFTFLGRRTLTVGTHRLRADAYRVDRVIGDHGGAEHNELWFDARSGLPVRVERNARLETETAIGAVTYREHGSFRLDRVEPRR